MSKPELEHMEASAQSIGRIIADALSMRHGKGQVQFCLILSGSEDEWFTYVSNIEKRSMVGLLKEAIVKLSLDPVPLSRDELGRMVRSIWIEWAKEQPNLKSSWLVPYDELSEPDKEVDRRIGEMMFRLGQEGKSNVR